MFWKKKQMVATPIEASPTVAATSVAPTVTKVEKPKVEKLPRPREIPALVGKHLIAEYKMDPELVPILKAVVRKSPKAGKVFDCRIFDESEAEASELEVKNYTSLDEHPDLILYEGWFDENSKRVELEERKKVNHNVPLFTEAEIQRKIEALSEPSSMVFFYQDRGPAVGGPLGRGAAIVELNPNYPGKKQKKYILYTANVVGMEPVGKRQKLMNSDKPKELAKWIKEAHHKRMW